VRQSGRYNRLITSIATWLNKNGGFMSNEVVYKELRKTAKALLFLIGIGAGLAIVISLLIFWGMATHRELVFWGLVSFAPVGLAIGIISTITAIINAFILRKRYPALWEAQNNGFEDQIRRRDVTDKDTGLRKLSSRGTLLGITCIILWFVVFIFVAVGALVLKIQICVDLLNNFK
jgi:hypothetical protein